MSYLNTAPREAGAGIDRRRWLSRALPIAGLTLAAPVGWTAQMSPPPPVYMGRELAEPFEAVDAGWLERSTRERQERPDWLVEDLALSTHAVVADVGAGTGYVARRLAARAARVFAVELQPALLGVLARAPQTAGGVIVPVPGQVDGVPLPERSVDLALMVDTYHELRQPDVVLGDLLRVLKPGGRLAIVEYRAEDRRVPIPVRHKMTEAQILRELAATPLEFERRSQRLPWQHLMLFRRPALA